MIFSRLRCAAKSQTATLLLAAALLAVSQQANALSPVPNAQATAQPAPAPQVITPQGTSGTPNLQRVAPAKNNAPAKSAAPAARAAVPAISSADRELIEAAFAGETWKAREALSRGAKIEARDFGYNWTPLMWASLKGHVGTVRYLLSRGANPNALGGGDRRMILLNMGRASSRTTGNTLLVERSGFFIANANTTALLLAASGGYGMTVEALLDKGARPGIAAASGDAPLAGAAYSGNLVAVEALLKEGAAVDARDFQGGTALVSAVLEGHTEVVRALLKRGASTRVTWRNTPITDLAKARGYGDISRLLRIANAKTSAANPRARTIAAPSRDDVKILN